MAELRLGLLVAAISVLCGILLVIALTEVPTLFLLLALALLVWFGGVLFLYGRS
jgi:hypothetical protein